MIGKSAVDSGRTPGKSFQGRLSLSRQLCVLCALSEDFQDLPSFWSADIFQHLNRPHSTKPLLNPSGGLKFLY